MPGRNGISRFAFTLLVVLLAAALPAAAGEAPATPPEPAAAAAAPDGAAPDGGCPQAAAADLADLFEEEGEAMTEVAPAAPETLEPVLLKGPPHLRRYCHCGCGAGCETDADCGPGGRCQAFVTCC
jgi:hypothetical protein